MRIALTHAFCWPEVQRGGERHMHELAGALARRGHAVTIFGGAPASSTRREDGVRVVRIGRGMQGGVDAERRFAARLFPRLVLGRFDVVHSFGPLDAVASLRARVVHPRRTLVYSNLGNPIRSWWETLPQNEAHERVVREIDVYGCYTNFALQWLRTDYGRTGALTPGGVRLETFRPTAPKEASPTLLFSGAIDEPRKGVDVLLEALPLIAMREPRVKLWLLGGGDAAPLFAAASPDAGERTRVLPRVPPSELSDQYSAAWVTVLPSSGEAFGLVLIESLACGTPIVAGDDAGAAELVTSGLGALTPPRDPRALADACLRAIEIARDPASKERCVSAAQAYDWETAVAPAMERLYASSGSSAGPHDPDGAA